MAEEKTPPEPVVLPDVATEPHPTAHADAEVTEKPERKPEKNGNNPPVSGR